MTNRVGLALGVAFGLAVAFVLLERVDVRQAKPSAPPPPTATGGADAERPSASATPPATSLSTTSAQSKPTMRDLRLAIERELAVGDTIVILGIRGEQDQFKKGSRYRVWGRYQLTSARRGLLRVLSCDTGGEEQQELESFSAQDASGCGTFDVSFQPTERMWHLGVQFWSADGTRKLGGVDLMNDGC